MQKSKPPVSFHLHLTRSKHADHDVIIGLKNFRAGQLLITLTCLSISRPVYVAYTKLPVYLATCACIEMYCHWCTYGAGEFADVYKGHLQLAQRSRSSSRSRRGHEGGLVAVKALKLGAGEQERCHLMHEASVMAQLDHPNVLYLEGVVTRSQPIMIVTEFMHNSSLDQFLQARMQMHIHRVFCC